MRLGSALQNLLALSLHTSCDRENRSMRTTARGWQSIAIVLLAWMPSVTDATENSVRLQASPTISSTALQTASTGPVPSAVTVFEPPSGTRTVTVAVAERPPQFL